MAGALSVQGARAVRIRLGLSTGGGVQPERTPDVQDDSNVQEAWEKTRQTTAHGQSGDD